MDIKNFYRDIRNRIREIRLNSNLKQKEFADILGISQGFMSDIETGKKLPGFEFLVMLSQKMNISIDWILTGKGNKYISKDEIYVSEKPLEYNEFVFIPQVEGKISAGKGLIPLENSDIKLGFRRDWIKKYGDPHNMSLILVSGDSMSPTLQEGDIVLVNHNENFLDPNGGIYAITINNMILIKRLQINFQTEKILVISDNPKYEKFEVDAGDIIINGKVIWFGREL